MIIIIKQLIAAMTLLISLLSSEVKLGAIAIDNITGFEQAEEAYFQSYGKYLQIIPDNLLPHYETGTVKSKLGQDVAPNWKTHVYETPKGEHGWQAFWEDANGSYSKGYGPEAISRTYSTLKDNTSSTTSFWFPKFDFKFWEGLIKSAYALTGNSHSTDLEAGSTQYWSITDAAQTGLDFSSDLTFSLWVNLESTPAAMGFIGKSTVAANNDSYEFLWADGAPDILQFVSWFEDGGLGCNFDFSQNLSTATWYNVAVTKSGTSLKVFLDGAQVGTTQTCTNGTIFNSTAPFVIGERLRGTIPFDGLIDDVRVWSRALSDTEISDLHTDPCNFSDGTNLEGQWLFDNDAGVDQTANNNDLTNNNSATFSTTAAYTCAAAATPARRRIIIQ